MNAAPEHMRPVAPSPAIENMPAELRALPQWVCWQYRERDGRWTKVPVQPNGQPASSTDPTTWTDIQTVTASAGRFDGIGFVTAATDPYVLIDLDHAIDENDYALDWADPILDAASIEGAYIERSVSGSGFHIIGRGEQRTAGKKRNDVELYTSGRFFTMSGDKVFGPTELGTLTETIRLVMERIGPEKKKAARSAAPSVVNLDDETLIQKIRRSKNDAKFSALFAGDGTGYLRGDGTVDQSAADLALATMLAFWTGKDEAQIERIMRRSGLARAKWDEARGDSTYLRQTIDKAVAGTGEVYTGGHRAKPAKRQDVPALDGDDDDNTDQVDGDEYADTDIGNGRRIAAAYGHKIRFTEAGGYLVYDGKRWAEDIKEVRLHRLAKRRMEAIFDEVKAAPDRDAMIQHARRSQSRRAIENAVVMLRSEPGILADLTSFDADPWLLNVANGTIDLRTGTLRPHDPADCITKLVSVSYSGSADIPLWTSFLTRITADNAELMTYLHKLCGYALTGLTTEQTLHFLHGGGANGKSVFCDVLAKLLGEYAVIAQPDMVMARRHGGIPNDIARLRGVRVALMNETTQGSRFDEAKLKDLTGGDKLTGRFLHREFFDFDPTHKLLIRGNHKPEINGTDEGIWRRLRLLPFTVEIPRNEQDPHLVAKLKRELPGILTWAVEGCLLWQREGLTPPACVTEAVSEYRADSDVLGRFIAECCEVRRLGQVKSSTFQTKFREYAESAGERGVPSKDLKHEMRKRGFSHRREKHGVLFEGIELRQTEGDARRDWHRD